jgi:hypothetical protein
VDALCQQLTEHTDFINQKHSIFQKWIPLMPSLISLTMAFLIIN